LVYSIALGGPQALPLDERQRAEVLLTAAQSLFAVTLLLDLNLSLVGAGILFLLFAVQMLLPETRLEVTVAYLVLAALVLVRSRRQVWRAFRWMRMQPAHVPHVQ
jgi:cation:H+ antiporter